MGKTTKIEYADSTVNPVVGCTGCELYSAEPAQNHCYAASMVRRMAGRPGWPVDFLKPAYFPGRLFEATRWPDLTGQVRPDKPWLNGAPRVVFVNDLGDGFAPNVDARWLLGSGALEQMKASPHWWLLLTKWPENMGLALAAWGQPVPPNLILGTTVTSQDTLWRLDMLARCRAQFGARIWLSMEPLLGPVELGEFAGELEFVAVGGESGPNARPTHPDWLRSVRNQALAAGGPFFFKQWGEWAPVPEKPTGPGDRARFFGGQWMDRIGKARAGRCLDGRTWLEGPYRKVRP